VGCESSDGDDAVVHTARGLRALGCEQIEVHPTRDDGHPGARPAHPHQLEHLVGAGRCGPGCTPGERGLQLHPLLRAGVPGALVAALDHAERVKGLYCREIEALGRQLRGNAGRPEVGVCDIRPVSCPLRVEILCERADVLQQFAFG
jgi:hypothetical protein